MTWSVSTWCIIIKFSLETAQSEKKNCRKTNWITYDSIYDAFNGSGFQDFSWKKLELNGSDVISEKIYLEVVKSGVKKIFWCLKASR